MKNYEFLVNRILSNRLTITIGDDKFVYRSPSSYIKYQSSLLYEEIIDEYKYEDWLTKEQAKFILIRNNLLSNNADEAVKTLDKEIEDHKVALFQNSFNEKQCKDIRKKLGLLKAKQNEVYNKIHRFDQFTLEGFADLAKYNYVFENSIFLNKKRISKINLPYYKLEQLIFQLNSNILDYSIMREIVRKEPWSSLWRASYGKPFKGNPADWTDEQKNMILISKMYDSIYKNSECPPDEVVNDDDMIDGWLILQRRESEKNKNTNYVQKSVKGLDKQKGNEVFLMAQSPEHAQKINELNDLGAKAIKAQREKVIMSSGGDVKDGQFLDKRLEVANQAKEMFAQTRGK